MHIQNWLHSFGIVWGCFGRTKNSKKISLLKTEKICLKLKFEIYCANMEVFSVSVKNCCSMTMKVDFCKYFQKQRKCRVLGHFSKIIRLKLNTLCIYQHQKLWLCRAKGQFWVVFWKLSVASDSSKFWFFRRKTAV